MLSRRDVLAAFAAGGGVLLAPRGRPLTAADQRAGGGLPPVLACDLAGWQTRQQRPSTPEQLRPAAWSQRMPVPPTRSGTDITLTLMPAEVPLLPGVMTPMLTYDGVFPGPTILAAPGQPIALRLDNQAEEGAVLHLHGVHAPAEHDGHVRDVIAARGWRDFAYPNAQRPALLWYHDHLLMRTAERVYRGLAGCYVLQDPSEAELGLPVGDERDIPVVLTDKTFDEDGSLVYDSSGHQPFFGDVILVNGADRPRLEVAAGLVRLRVLNASNARGYLLQRADGQPLRHISTDGGLLAAPVDRPRLELWPSERVEVLLDLSGSQVGEHVDIADGDTPILRVEVVDTGVAGPVAVSFPPLGELPGPEVVREVTLDEQGGRFLLDGHGYDGDVRDVFARLGAVERWRIVNRTTASHPIHLHLVTFRVRSRATAAGPLPLRPEDDGWKDTVLVRAFETVEIDARFADHLGDFMWHCHILEHEDHDMMSQFRVVDLTRIAGRNRVESAAAVLTSLAEPPTVVAVASGLDWPAAVAGAAVADALVLVVGSQLDPAAEAALRERPPRRIVIVGGTGEVPHTVEGALADIAPTERVVGDGPAGTAAAVAKRLRPQSESAVLATTADWPDALAAGTTGAPVLLTDPTALSPAARNALAQMGVSSVLIAGGPLAVHPDVDAQLMDMGIAVERVQGPDRFATAAAFARRREASDVLWAVSGHRFPDALAAGAAARAEGTLVLVADGRLPAATAQLIHERQPTSIRIVGGPAAVPLAAEEALAQTLVPGWQPPADAQGG